MWQGNQDSDQSISDGEEEQNAAWLEKMVSLGGTLDRKQESLGVASHLELLKGLRQKYVGFSSEDEVEIPDFQDKHSVNCARNSRGKPISSKRVGSTCEVNKHISDDEGSRIRFNSVIAGTTVSETLDLYTRGKGERLEQWSAFAGDGDSRRQIQLDKLTAIGGRQPQRKSTCHFQSHNQESLWRSVHESKKLESTIDNELLDEPECNSPLGGCDSEKISETMHALPSEAALNNAHYQHSMVELLDDLHGKKRNLHLKLKLGRRKGKTVHRGVIKSMLPPQRAVEEDQCEIMNSDSSMDEEEKDNSLKRSAKESQRKTMADKFNEAFDFAYVGSKPLFKAQEQASTGLFERLQQVLQSQKDADAEFLKKLQAEVWPRDEARCIDVRILSRSYDAKLTVCRCSLLENEESSLENTQEENFRKIWTIIFNPRVCGDVDLDVSSVVRVHPPWKEVQVAPGGEILILASYFSQIYR